MTWAPLLLSDPSPSLRILVLQELLGRDENDDEVKELRKLQKNDPLITRLLALQNKDGSWRAGEDGAGQSGAIRLTSQALMGLGYMGLPSTHPAVKKGAEYIFSQQQDDGSWPLGIEEFLKDDKKREDIKYHITPLQTSLPLLGLALSGYAADPRSEKAYDWLEGKVLPEGGWFSGMHNDRIIAAAGYRRLAHTQFGCRTNTTAAVFAMALHPERRSSDAAKRGLDLLLAHEHRQAYNIGFEVARITGFEKARGMGTYYKRYDVGQMLDLSWRIGANLDDERVAENVKFIKQLQGNYGLWEYSNDPRASRWVSFDLLRSLSRIDTRTDWVSFKPRTGFQAYPKKPKRF